jgi:steroid 5-alpha reductase family enzyme
MLSVVSTRLLEAWAIAATLQLLLWLIAQRTRNAGIVDVGWAFSFTLIASYIGYRGLWSPLTAVVIAWSLRLTLYLIARGAASGPEEGRYEKLRTNWAPHASRNFLVFFQAQALLSAILTTGFVVPSLSSPVSGRDALMWIGTAIAALAILGEGVADAQLAAFKRRAQRSAVCDVGLWNWSRHPNYFFEWLYWVGLATASTAHSYGWIAWPASLLILASIFKVTGVPATEAQALRSKGDAYRRYQARTSVFVPWPPRKDIA